MENNITDLDAIWLRKLKSRRNNSTIQEDLQLAAELGKTLLERNKELELALKQQQNLIEEKNLEIEYLSKQTYELREVNESRWKLYEQLEYSIQDMEREKQQFLDENKNEKRKNRNLKDCLDKFEEKCFDLQQTIEKCQFQLQLNEKTIQELLSKLEELKIENSHILEENYLLKKQKSLLENFKESNTSLGSLSDSYNDHKKSENQNTKVEIKSHDELKDDKINELEKEIHDLKVKRSQDLRKFEELEEQISTLIRENRILDNELNELRRKDDEVKNLSDELLSIDTIQKGYVCTQCLKSNNSNNDNYNHEFDSYNFSTSIEQSSVISTVNNESNDKENPYKDLVEKYEATIESRNELLENNSEDKSMKIVISDLSDTETTISSGFLEDVAHKSTQTVFRPGSFLFTVENGDDCKFSIYDESSVLENRFRDSPEYKHLFEEIFDVLKKAAERKSNGQMLPLLDDQTSVAVSVPKVPEVTPASEIIAMANIEDENVNQSKVVSEPMAIVDQCVQEKLSNENQKSQEQEQHEMPTCVEDTKSVISVQKVNKNFKKPQSKSKNQKGKKKYIPLDISTIDINAVPIKKEATEKKQCIHWEYPPNAAIMNLQKLRKLEISYAEVLKKSLYSYNR